MPIEASIDPDYEGIATVHELLAVYSGYLIETSS